MTKCKTFKRSNIALLLSFLMSSSLLVACGGGGGGSSDNPTPSPAPEGNTFNVTITSNFNPQSIVLNPSYSDDTEDRTELVFETSGNVTHITSVYGKVTEIPLSQVVSDNLSENQDLAKTTKKWNYQLDLNKLRDKEIPLPIDDVLTITDGSQVQKYNISNYGLLDPLVGNEWHIYNFGATLYGNKKAITPNIDNNALYANFKFGFTGKDRVVLVYDRIIDFEHPDLKDRKFDVTNIAENPDAFNESYTSSYISTSASFHGNAVAGILASSKNRIGTQGVAPNTKLISYKLEKDDLYKYLSDGQFRTTLDAINLSAIQPFVEFGKNTNDWYALSNIAYSYDIPIIKAAGNFALDPFYFGSLSYILKDPSDLDCKVNKISCSPSQHDYVALSPYSILVGSVSAYGERSIYSEATTGLWVSAPGGQRKTESNIYNIVTTFYRFTCDEIQKVNKLTYSSLNSFDKDNNCLYTNTMNGTSAATPNVTGVVSLLKEKYGDNKLTINQVKYILAKTAKNDKSIPSLVEDKKEVSTSTLDKETTKILAHDGWTDIGHDLRFNSNYGFGLVDAFKALSFDGKNDPYFIKRKKAENQYYLEGHDCEEVNSTIDGLHEYSCKISHAHDTQEHSSFSGNVEIEAIQVNFDPIKFVRNNLDPSYCLKSKDVKNLDEAREHYKSYAYYQVELTSPLGRTAIVKPYSTFMLPTENSSSDSSKDSLPMRHYLVNNFYLNKVNTDDNWTLNIKSKCSLDINSLNDEDLIYLHGYID